MSEFNREDKYMNGNFIMDKLMYLIKFDVYKRTIHLRYYF